MDEGSGFLISEVLSDFELFAVEEDEGFSVSDFAVDLSAGFDVVERLSVFLADAGSGLPVVFDGISRDFLSASSAFRLAIASSSFCFFLS